MDSLQGRTMQYRKMQTYMQFARVPPVLEISKIALSHFLSVIE
jgi:hypothetical protein